MPLFNTVSESREFVFKVDTSLSSHLSQCVKSMNFNLEDNTITKIDGLAGIKNLSINYSVSRNSYSHTGSVNMGYEKKISNEYTLKAEADLCDDGLTINIKIEHSSGFAIGIEATATISWSELQKNGLFLVAAIPICGMQVVIKYNIATQQIGVELRAPLLENNNDDIKNAVQCGGHIICQTVDVKKKIVTRQDYQHRVNQYQENTPVYNTSYRTNTSHQVEGPSVIENIFEGIGNGITNVVNGFVGLFQQNNTREERYAYN
ncbi:hypothetical protein FO519_009617 [Halicephalobus sp. NKZ332]|nr:hypothetical protein FO519_009617 [Halicephalobus sp. NKZ332]